MSRRKTICFITSVPESFHAQRLTGGIFAQCEKYGYHAAVFGSMISLDLYFEDYAKGERNIYELIQYEKFDGIILDNISLIYSNRTELLESVCEHIKKRAKCPVYAVGIPFGDIPCIDNNNDEMLRAICRHAIEVHGSKKICILTGMKGNHEAEERLAILRDEIKQHGLAVADEHLVYGDFWFTSGNKLAEDIASGRISRPDTVIAVSDHMALGVIEKLTELGIRVPDEIRVLGFDATSESTLNDIPLTTIESNFAKCGADAVNRIRAEIEPGEPILPYQSDMTSMMQIGISCGCMPDMKRALENIKSSLYFVSRNYTDETFMNNIDIGLLMENYILEQLAASDTPEQCLYDIYRTTYMIYPFSSFFLCLREDWLDMEHDITAGYPEKMCLSLTKSNIGDREFYENKIRFDTAEMLPNLFEDRGKPYAFYFSAVHFGSKTLGYTVLQREMKDYKRFNLVFRNWLRFVNTALEMSRSKHRLSELSVHDKMTGLLNRRGMYEQYDIMLKKAKPGDMLFACVIDMDGLKYINDTFGHSEGDFGIITVSEAALEITGQNEICVRSGGDEFYIIGIGHYHERICTEKVEHFNNLLAKRSVEANKPYSVTASIGCTFRPLSEDDKLDDALIVADEIMYHHKITRNINRQ